MANRFNNQVCMYVCMVFSLVIIFFSVLLMMILLKGIKVIRITHRGMIETLGNPVKFKNPGITYVSPVIQKLVSVNITEQIIDIKDYQVSTKDNIKCILTAQAYYKINEDEESIKHVLYDISNFDKQIIHLIKSTISEQVSGCDFKEINSKYLKISDTIHALINRETVGWGITITKIIIEKIQPPPEIQDAMSKILETEQEQIAVRNKIESEKLRVDAKHIGDLKLVENRKEIQMLDAKAQNEYNKKIAKSEAEAMKIVSDQIMKSHKDGTDSLDKMFEKAKEKIRTKKDIDIGEKDD